MCRPSSVTKGASPRSARRRRPRWEGPFARSPPSTAAPTRRRPNPAPSTEAGLLVRIAAPRPFILRFIFARRHASQQRIDATCGKTKVSGPGRLTECGNSEQVLRTDSPPSLDEIFSAGLAYMLPPTSPECVKRDLARDLSRLPNARRYSSNSSTERRTTCPASSGIPDARWPT